MVKREKGKAATRANEAAAESLGQDLKQDWLQVNHVRDFEDSIPYEHQNISGVYT